MSKYFPTPMPPPSAPAMMYTTDHSSSSSGSTRSSNTKGNANIDEASFRNELLRQGYTPGLVNAISQNRTAFAHCYWIVDNSGSMQTQDGHRIISSDKDHKLQFMPCSRWREMVETVEYHSNMAALTRAPTTFRLLNNPGRQVGSQIFSIATSPNPSSSNIDHELAVAVSVMSKTQPSGVTPLTEHIITIRQSIDAILPQLYANGQKVAIVLATDGLPTDENGNSSTFVNEQFRKALESLEGLPVWVVVRLCTDEDHIVQFWNDLDSQLEISLEVLDDYVSEGQEIYAKNPWITYGLPLHRMREMGCYNRIFDMLDEQSFSKTDICDFVHVLFGKFDAPDPDIYWDLFCNTVEQVQRHQFNNVKQWNPVHQKLMPWIDIKKLRQHNKSTKGGWFF